MAPAVRAIGYVRVSTEQQAERGVSLDAQAEKIRAMAVVQDANLLDVITDAGASAKDLNRPGLARVLALVDKRQIDVVIVAKLDRLTRSVRDLGELLERFERRSVSLVSVAESLDTGTAAGRLVLNVMASVSQWEREVIGERTREALAHKKMQGQRVGTVPFGYALADDGVTLVDQTDEQAVLGLLRERRAAGFSLRAISDELNRHGFTTRRGTPWRFEYVRNLVKADQPTATI
jgi:site-specific DNA recombinase